MEGNSYQNQDLNNSILEAEIDFTIILEKIIRHKYTLVKFSIIGLILSAISAFSAKKIWQGGFQIVIQDNSNAIADNFSQRLNLGVLSGNGGFNNSRLSTQVEILKSPSVLISAFQEIKSRTKNDNLNFNDWKKSFKFDLKRNTSVLDISYKHPNKQIILDTLSLVSDSYQKYSGTKREREIELGLNFINEQLPIYEKNASNSIKEAQDYAYKYDLILPNLVGGPSMGANTEGVNPELKRIKEINNIRILKEKLNVLSKSELNPEQLILYAEEFIPNSEELRSLIRVNSSLFSLAEIYTEKDRTIINLKSEKKILLKKIKDETYKALLASIKDSETIVEASARPEGVISKYKQLLLKASQDQNSYKELENQYRLTLLEKSRIRDPWKLITEPTILPNALGPRKLTYLIFGIFFGTITGIIFSLFKDKIEDLVFSETHLKKLLPYKILGNLDESNMDEYNETIDLLFNPKNNNFTKDILILKFVEVNDNRVEKIIKSINSLNKEFKIKISENFKDIYQFENVILLCELGLSKISTIKKLQSKLDMQKINIFGILTLFKIKNKKKANKNLNTLKNVFKIL